MFLVRLTHCIVCHELRTDFVDRCSSFGPCSFDHCNVCTAYDYFVDRCSSGQTNKDQKTNNDLQSKHNPYTQCWSNEQGPFDAIAKCVRIMLTL